MTAESPWYRDSLRFSCTRCGRCCTGDPGYVWVTRREVEALAEYCGLDLDRFARRYLRRVKRRYSLKEKANYDCVFYDGGCTVYPARPRQCRTFPFWPENLRTRGAWEEVAGDCPGVGRGRVYPVEEVRRILKGEADTSA